MFVSAIGPRMHIGMAAGLLHSCNCFGKGMTCRAIISGGSDLGTNVVCAISVGGPCFVSAICCRQFAPRALQVVRHKHQVSCVDPNRRFGIISLSRRHSHVDALLHGLKCFCFHPSCVACRTSAALMPKKRVDLHLVPIPKLPTTTRHPCCINSTSICLFKGGKRTPGSDVVCGGLGVRCCGGLRIHPGVLCH